MSINVHLANLFVPITIFLYSPFFFVWLFHSYFTLYNTFSQFLYSSILVQLAMFLLVTSLLIFNHLLLHFFSVFLCCHLVQRQTNFFSSPLLTGCIVLSTPLNLPSVFKFLLSVLPLQYSTVYNPPFPNHLSFQSTQITFHTVQEVAKRSRSPSTVEQSGGAHKEAVHTAANDLCLEPNKSIKLQSNAQMAASFGHS